MALLSMPRFFPHIGWAMTFQEFAEASCKYRFLADGGSCILFVIIYRIIDLLLICPTYYIHISRFNAPTKHLMAPSLSGGLRDPSGASRASTTKPCRPEPHMSAKMLTVNMPEAISKTQRCFMSFTVVSLHAWEEIGVLVLVWAFTIHLA